MSTEIWKDIEVRLDGGLNTKVDEKVVKTPQVTELKNMTFDDMGGMRTRGEFVREAPGQISSSFRDQSGGPQGVISGVTFVGGGAKSLYTRKNELLIQGEDRTYKVSGKVPVTSNFDYIQFAWRVPFSVTKDLSSRRNSNQVSADYAENADNTWGCMVWAEVAAYGYTEHYEVRAAVYDLRSNTLVHEYILEYQATVQAGGTVVPKVQVVFCSNSDRWVIVWSLPTGAGAADVYSTAIQCRDDNMPEPNLGASVSVNTLLSGSAVAGSGLAAVYSSETTDVTVFTGEFFSGVATGDIYVLQLSSLSGALTNSAVQALGTPTNNGRIAASGFTSTGSGTTKIAVILVDNSGNVIGFTWDTGTFTTLTSPTTIDSGATGVYAYPAVLWRANNEIALFYSDVINLSTIGNIYNLYYREVTSSLTGGTAQQFTTGFVAANPVVQDVGPNAADVRDWVIVCDGFEPNTSKDQDGSFFVYTRDVYDTGYGYDEYRLQGRLSPGSARIYRNTYDALPHMTETAAGGAFKVPLLYAEEIAARDPNNNVVLDFYTGHSIALYTLDTNDAEIGHSVEFGENTYMPGGMLWKYDGAHLTEAGFLQYPTYQDVSSSGGAGSESYAYRGYFAHTDSAGERTVSTYKGDILLENVNAPNVNKVDTEWSGLGHSRRSDANNVATLEVYRTTTGPTYDSFYHLVSSTDPVDASLTNNGYVTLRNDLIAVPAAVVLDDAFADADAEVRGYDYASVGEVDNIAPPACTVIGVAKERMWLAGGEIPKDVLWYSKKRQEGRTAEFSDFFTITLPQRGGNIRAVAELNGAVIVFKETAIFAIEGDGPGNTGVGSWGRIVEISTDIGTNSQRTVISADTGIIFTNDFSVYLLGRDLVVQDIGVPVRDLYQASSYVRTIRVPDTDEILFVPSSGNALIFNEDLSAWGQWVSSTVGLPGARDAAVANGDLVLLESDGDLSIYNPGVFSTEASVSTITSPWLSLETLQSLFRLKRIQILGEFEQGVVITVEVQYDYDETDSITLTYNTAAKTGLALKQFEAAMRRQKAQAVRFKITDSGAARDWRVNAMLIRVQPLARNNPVESTQRIG